MTSSTPNNTRYPPYHGKNVGQQQQRQLSQQQSDFQANAYPAYGAQLNQGNAPSSSSYPGMHHGVDQVAGGPPPTSADSYNDTFDRTSRTRLVSETSQVDDSTTTATSHAPQSRIQPPSYGNGYAPGSQGEQNGSSNNGPAYPAYAYGNTNGQMNGAQQLAHNQNQHQFMHHQHHPHEPIPPASEIGKGRAGFSLKDIQNLSPKAKKRLIYVAILAVLALILIILFEVYKDDFERWVTPLRDWLKEREAWSWVIPTAILVILSFPPLFGHELVLIVVGLAYPIGVAIGVACAGAILGEALVFLVFKYALSGKVRRKCEQKVSWAAIARVSQEAGFKGVMIIRYSIVPPHLANPIFATTGMTFWLYMVSVILSLPKQIIFVVLGDPSNKGETGAKIGKVIAVGVLVIVTLYGTRWIRGRLAIATREIKAEREADIAKHQHFGAGSSPGVNGQQQMPAAATAGAGPATGLGRDASLPTAIQEDEQMSASERREWQQHMEMQAHANQPQNAGSPYDSNPYQAR